eukprot:5230156-Prymnesium_polylepis.1
MLPGTTQRIASTPVPIRLVDGGFGDVGGAAYTLAAMQAGCAHEPYNCTQGPGLILLNADQGEWFGIDARQYFADFLGGVEPGEYLPDDFSSVPTFNPSAVIFTDRYDDLNFTTFSASAYNIDETNPHGASYWMGELRTITNGWYGVRGGHNVSALIVNLNSVNALRSVYADLRALESDFREWHAPAADTFARALRPIFAHFILGDNGTATSASQY